MIQDAIHVAAAAIIDPEGRVLLTRRHDHLHQGGLWEFPGGKLEPGETVEVALRREIREELDLKLLAHRPLIQVRHHYPDRSVLLDVHLVTDYQGEARGMEGQPLAWVEPGELDRYPMPAADRPIVAALNLPDKYLITGADPTEPERFLACLERALEKGVRLVQLRAPGLPEALLAGLAEAAVALCHRKDARLLLNGTPELAERVGADGVHLNRHHLLVLDERPLGDDRLVAASCHSAEELARAAHLGADFVVLSPVLPTASHPDAVPIGWERFAELAAEMSMPVYALGGMREGLIPEAWAHGGQGIAGISGLWPV